MRVDHLSNEERVKLYFEWVSKKDNNELPDDFSEYSLEGNLAYLTTEQLLNPNYVLPEWNTPLPEWLRLADKIGKECINIVGDHYIFKGIATSYVDFYYIVSPIGSDEIRLESCVGDLKFI